MAIPLRDYYPVDRASELLGCKIDDLIHWAMVGCVRLYIKIDHAYGVLVSDELNDLAGSDDYNIVTDSTEYKDKLSELDRGIDPGDLYEQNEFNDGDYIYERAKIIYHAMTDYMHKKGDVKYLDEVGLRYDFANLEYYFKSEVAEDFCLIRSVEWLRREFNQRWEDYGDIFSDIEQWKKNDLVYMQGFFSLGEDFYRGYNFLNKIVLNKKGEFINTVYMPESKLRVNIVSNESIELSNDGLYLFKDDFMIIYNAMKDGLELKKKNSWHRISGNHIWWKSLQFDNKNNCDKGYVINKSERISRPAICALNILISKYHADIKQSPSKLAEVLTAEARELGLDGIEFDKNTVSRWIKKSYQ